MREIIRNVKLFDFEVCMFKATLIVHEVTTPRRLKQKFLFMFLIPYYSKDVKQAPSKTSINTKAIIGL